MLFNFNFALVIPTCNAGEDFVKILQVVKNQTLPIDDDKILVIDSSSTDDTSRQVARYGARCHVIPRAEFNHGATRQLALSLCDADIYIFLTQDAIPAHHDAIANLIAAFADEKVGCAYGRQLPAAEASVLAAHARLFNYPAQSEVRSFADKDRLGIKACFNSDSFAAYRKSALLAVGGFPSDVVVGEDVYVAAKMLMSDWKVAYQAEARVYHSHNYSVGEEFKRYCKIGDFHAKNTWILQNFTCPFKLGVEFARSEIAYCISKRSFFSLLQSIAHLLAKFCGYKLGSFVYSKYFRKFKSFLLL